VQEGALEDERRLAYVAFTRASDRLALSWAATR
jgi:superfamily I DNA/RNA helicase